MYKVPGDFKINSVSYCLQQRSSILLCLSYYTLFPISVWCMVALRAFP